MDQQYLNVELKETSRSPDKLNLDCRMKNVGKTRIYVYDRLWDPKTAFLIGPKQTLPDSNSPYRFIKGDQLTLFYGLSPQPPAPTGPSVQITSLNIPHTTLLKKGQKKNFSIPLEFPIKEYNCYFGKPNKKNCEKTTIKSIQVIFQYAYKWTDVQSFPSKYDPKALIVEIRQDINNPGLGISKTILKVDPFVGYKHLDKFSRPE